MLLLGIPGQDNLTQGVIYDSQKLDVPLEAWMQVHNVVDLGKGVSEVAGQWRSGKQHDSQGTWARKDLAWWEGEMLPIEFSIYLNLRIAHCLFKCLSYTRKKIVL